MKADDSNNQPRNKGMLFSYGLHQRSRSGWKGEVERQGGEHVRGQEEVRLDFLEGIFPKPGH